MTKRALPSPPFPPRTIVNSCPGVLRSVIGSSVSGSRMIVPFGTSRIRSSPERPVRFELWPWVPFSAANCLYLLNSLSVLMFSFTFKMMLAPLPPSPPSGPPLATNFSRRKLTHPSPPFPPMNFTVVLSQNIF